MSPALLLRIGLPIGFALGGSACVPSGAPPPAPVDGPTSTARGLSVTLLWAPPVDLDLYVTDPALESVYFANPRAASGGRLARDATCAEADEGPREAESRRETVLFEAPAAGRYRVGVDYIDHCGSEQVEVGYRLVVRAPGLRRETTGSVRLARFVYRALEFELPGSDPERER